MRNFKDYHYEKLADPQEQKRHLEVAFDEYKQDGDTRAFLLALKDIAESNGGLAVLAEKTNLNRQNLYRALSSEGNPRLSTVDAILRGLGFCLSVEALA